MQISYNDTQGYTIGTSIDHIVVNQPGNPEGTKWTSEQRQQHAEDVLQVLRHSHYTNPLKKFIKREYLRALDAPFTSSDGCKWNSGYATLSTFTTLYTIAVTSKVTSLDLYEYTNELHTHTLDEVQTLITEMSAYLQGIMKAKQDMYGLADKLTDRTSMLAVDVPGTFLAVAPAYIQSSSLDADSDSEL